jgi:amidase
MPSVDSIIEAEISSIAEALSLGRLTAVDLVAKYLIRIASYDCRNTSLNSIPLLSDSVFKEAEASDDRRKSGTSHGDLDGVPFTVKDSYQVKGMTVAAGAEAFKDLIATVDAFLVTALRSAGAVVLGRTNMCPMAYGGMLRGVYGRAESPYNVDYLTAAFGSGSSNGSGTSTAASFAAFGLGGETVSSGRSPASNNALVAYTPSRGIISERGTWPLYPTCDVAITHTRTMNDLIAILDVISQEDKISSGDFWRDQTLIKIPDVWSKAPRPIAKIKDSKFLRGKRIAVPQIYLKQVENGPYVSESIYPLWLEANSDLEKAGAIVQEVPTLPVIAKYEAALLKAGSDEGRALGMPDDWNSVERGALIAFGWEQFLKANDGNIKSLVGVDPWRMFPKMSWDSPQLKFTEPANMVQWPKLAEYVEEQAQSGQDNIHSFPGLEAAVQALEAMRKQWFEAWLTEHNFDFVAFPAVGDVGKEDAEESYESAEHAWRNGVKYSHGNRALRHLGIPSVTVPMGELKPQDMPIGLTFLGPAYEDINLLKAAYAYEQVSKKRLAPPRTPAIASDRIPTESVDRTTAAARPSLAITVKATAQKDDDERLELLIEGRAATSSATFPCDLYLEVYIDGKSIPASDISIDDPVQDGEEVTRCFRCQHTASRPPTPKPINEVVGKVARDSTMVIVLARNGKTGWPAGSLKLIHKNDLDRAST